ncbi:adventurous gliding motility lipoprotein CglC [Hyalangium rubrum]|uniref:Adventurous gliding motility lipoprotein CglC n=1 Tax=Hyalangium rubrum TaxID=3103134 RepID=A0ABU5GWY1_9BACT|nr:adventurous gliding motility lipoprotein CglC [Hyalangium sp. s54d21]MDY7225382.1 adventurous gliding motility lipoprotein CglC [Hyalangium sp. s54d21]
MSPRLVIFLSAALLASGCSVTSELGKECVLVKKPTQEELDQGILSVPVLESDVAPRQDFISFGSTSCVELICVRDADFPRNPDQNAVALGYCSQACIEGADATACEVTEPSAPEELRARMECRSLLLDQASLERLRAEDPAAYRATFGDNNSPYFCAGGLATLPEG